MFISLGKTGIQVNKNGFGALPIQRISTDEAINLLRYAYQQGINFYDTARFYTDSEEKIGKAFQHTRKNVILATKTMAKTPDDFWTDLETSLILLQTDYIDLYQFHNPAFCPELNDGSGLAEAMIQAKTQGKIRHIGITSHRYDVAKKALLSGFYETLQFPFSYISGKQENELVALSKQKEIGFIAMKALSGGLITHTEAAFAFIWQFEHVVPIWGIQRQAELEMFLQCAENPPAITEEMKKEMEADRQELGRAFCRGCGYCLPCPVGIEIPTAARMTLMLKRAPVASYTTKEWIEKMNRIHDCTHCNQCSSRCPYQLDTPALLQENLEDYQKYVD